jgi:hypothetical protein
METIPVSRHVQGHQEWVQAPGEKFFGPPPARTDQLKFFALDRKD